MPEQKRERLIPSFEEIQRRTAGREVGSHVIGGIRWPYVVRGYYASWVQAPKVPGDLAIEIGGRTVEALAADVTALQGRKDIGRIEGPMPAAGGERPVVLASARDREDRMMNGWEPLTDGVYFDGLGLAEVLAALSVCPHCFAVVPIPKQMMHELEIHPQRGY
jgi:hypothetical protein